MARKRLMPKNLQKFTIEQKKKFIKLYDEGALNTLYFSYLALNQGEVEYLKEHVEEIKKEVAVHEKERNARQEKLRNEANKENDLVKKHGVVLDVKKRNSKLTSWTVAEEKEKQFLKDCSTRTVEWMLDNWCDNRDVLLKEIDRIEKDRDRIETKVV